MTPNTCKTCGMGNPETIQTADGWSVAHFCDDFEVIVHGPYAGTKAEAVALWNEQNEDVTPSTGSPT